jgi:amino acid transporter
MMGERGESTSLRAAGAMILVSIAMAGLFYVLVIVASSMTMPWRELLTLPMPTAEGFRRAFHSELLAQVVLAAAVLGLVTTWNSVFMFASRVLFTLGRARLMAPSMGIAHERHGSPANAVLFVGVVSGAAVLLGRGALLPIVNVAGMCLAGAALLICLGVIRFRRIAPDVARPYRVPGGSVTAAIAAAVCLWMVAWGLIEPALAGGIAPEWLVLGAWAALGALMWTVARGARSSLTEAERHRLVVDAATNEQA